VDTRTVAARSDSAPAFLSDDASATDLYLDLMKRCLTNSIYGASEGATFDADERATGHDWPPTAHSMIGLRRLDQLQFCVEDVIHSQVPGDLIETGVWRGGASIFMRAVLRAHGVTDRTVWVADSFEGLPPPDLKHFPQDTGPVGNLHRVDYLAVSLDRVKDNFRAYGLLDDHVRFLKGWFKDTLPKAPVERLAVLRMDGDMYQSTMEALEALYPKLSVGGYVIVDDYGAIEQCRQAVHDYREAHGISDELTMVDWTGAHWKRSS
jgi:Macrocin-O-methyltransferase (TylF)